MGGWGRRRGSRRPVPRPGPFDAAPPLASRGRPVGRGRSCSVQLTTKAAPVSSAKTERGTWPTRVDIARPLLVTKGASGPRSTGPVSPDVCRGEDCRDAGGAASSAALRAHPEGADLGRPAAGDRCSASRSGAGTHYAESWEIADHRDDVSRRRRRPPRRGRRCATWSATGGRRSWGRASRGATSSRCW